MKLKFHQIFCLHPQAPIILSTEGSDSNEDMYTNTDCHFQYFKVDDMEWKQMRKFTKPPHLASLIVVGGSLYAVGGCCDDVGDMHYEQDFYVFDVEKNSWKELPSMIHPHDMEYLKLVHLDGFIYVSAGYCRGNFHGNNIVERFDLAEEKWEVLSELPGRDIRWSEPFIYQGRILISGVEVSVLKWHQIFEYNSSANAWQTILTEPFDNLAKVEPVLFVNQGNIYRVVYKSSDEYLLCKPVVHVLELKSIRNGIGLSVGEEVNQDWIPANRLGAFRIQRDVFVNAKGYVQMTNLKIESDQTSDVDLQIWEGFALKWENYTLDSGLLQSSNVTCFTFDKKKFGGC